MSRFGKVNKTVREFEGKWSKGERIEWAFDDKRAINCLIKRRKCKTKKFSWWWISSAGESWIQRSVWKKVKGRRNEVKIDWRKQMGRIWEVNSSTSIVLKN